MKTNTLSCCTGRRPAGRQRGLVLFIALIALLVVSLAAVALIRSVDTATLVAGNLSAKKTATNAGEVVLVDVNTWLGQKIATPGLLDATIQGEAYYASVTFPGVAELTDEATWTDANSRKAQLRDCNQSLGDTDCSGNQIRYLVERMCRNTGLATREHCLFGPGSDNKDSKMVQNLQEDKPVTSTGDSPLYRVTARVTGPKGTVSYIQSFVY